jgi:hypothetical protein
MVGAIINVLIGLFIWMLLPSLIYSKRKYQKNTPQFFVKIACKIIGIAIVAVTILNLIRSFLS